MSPYTEGALSAVEYWVAAIFGPEDRLLLFPLILLHIMWRLFINIVAIGNHFLHSIRKLRVTQNHLLLLVRLG